MEIVYIDSVFVMNTLMDYWLLLCTARLSGIGLVRWRYWLAAVLGGAYGVAVFLLPSWGSGVVAKGVVAIVLVLIAFGGHRQWMRLGLVFLGLSCAMAGGVLGLGMVSGHVVSHLEGVLYTDINPGVILVAAAVGYGLIRLVFFAAGRNGVEGMLLPVTLHHQGRSVDLVALYDTGNGLQDGATGRSVLVVSARDVASLWSGTMAPWLTASRVANPMVLLDPLRPLGLSPRLIPYQGVGVGSGFLLGVVCHQATIAGQHYDNLVVALSPNDLGNGYSALWGQKGTDYEQYAEKITNVG